MNASQSAHLGHRVFDGITSDLTRRFPCFPSPTSAHAPDCQPPSPGLVVRVLLACQRPPNAYTVVPVSRARRETRPRSARMNIRAFSTGRQRTSLEQMTGG